MKFENYSVGDRSSSQSVPFSISAARAVTALESITSAEFAAAVPNVRMWEVYEDGTPKFPNPDDRSKPLAPLSARFIEPPVTGRLVNDRSETRFAERPDVSISDITIKTSNYSRGTFVLRDILINIVVHRPEALFDFSSELGDSWSVLLIPGRIIEMEYGWTAHSGVKNGLINGEGISALNENPPYNVPGLKRIKFKVTSYDFSVKKNNEIHIGLKAYEQYEDSIQNRFFGVIVDELSQEIAPNTKKGKKNVESVQVLMDFLTKKKKNDHTVNMGDVLDNLVAPALALSFRSIGYSSIRFFVGEFNESVGKTVKKFGAMQLSGQPIRNFTMPLDVLRRKLSVFVKNNEEMTVRNFVNLLCNVMNEPGVWDKSNTKIARSPWIQTKVITRRNEIAFYICDLTAEIKRLTSGNLDDYDKLPKNVLKERIEQAGVPFVSMMKGSSYIKDNEFNAQVDDPLLSSFIQKSLRPTRGEITQQQDKFRRKDDRLFDPAQVLYASSIRGSLTTLGNFIFDVFTLLWIDFDVKEWSGPFYVMGVEDKITRGEFTTTIELQSAGDDPLKTQGRLKAIRALTSAAATI